MLNKHKLCAVTALLALLVRLLLLLFFLTCKELNMCIHKTNLTNAPCLNATIDFEDITDNCDYETLDRRIENTEADLSIIQLNIRGLTSKIGDLKHLIDNSFRHRLPDILLLCETWLKSNSPKPHIAGYTMEREDRKKKQGGGVGLLISKRCRYRRRTDIEKIGRDTIESCFIELETTQGNTLIGSLYRPPNTPPSEFLKNFNNIATILQTEKKNVIMGLDHNMDLLKHQSHNQTKSFLESIYNQGLVPLITKPTRITSNSATLIDNILVSQKLSDSTKHGIICDHISDHLPCYALFENLAMKKKGVLTITSRDVRKKNMDALKKKLADGILSPPSELDVNEQFDYFHDNLSEAIDHFLPIVTRKIPYKSIRREKWISPGLLRSIQICKKKYSKHIKNRKNNKLHDEYLRYNSTLQKLKRHAKRSFYHEQCTVHKSNTRKLWQTINHVIRKSNNKTETIDKLKINNIAEYRGEVIVEEMAHYFANVGQTFAGKIKPSNRSELDYLKQIPPNPLTIYLNPVTTIEISRILDKLLPKNSCGVDNINNKLLKELKSQLLVPLEQIFNRSLEEGIFPERMKTAKVIPLYKGNGRDLASNYRPISLLLTLSKVLEKIMYKRVYGFLDQTNQLYVSQYGFRKQHACEHAVGELVSSIVKGFEEGKQTAAVFLDLSKAFDTLNHSTVLLKLDRYGLRGNCLNWFRSYLSNRKMQISCRTGDTGNEQTSRTHKVEYGAPQGSCLGPLIFLIYCNDLQVHLLYLSCIQFADDTTLYIKHRKQSLIRFALDYDLRTLQDWFRANKLTLNVGKSVCILFDKTNTADQLNLSINGETIPQVSYTKFLGMWIDQNLNWKEHIGRLIIKLSKNSNLLKMSKNFLTPTTQKIVYYAHIHSNLIYGLGVWGNMSPQCSLNKLQAIQNTCVSLIDNRKTKESIYQSHEILKVRQNIELEGCKLWHKHYLGELPRKLAEEMSRNHKNQTLNKNHRYNTRNKHLINIALAKGKSYSTSFLVKGHVDYVKHTDLIDTRTSTVYSKRLKKKLLHQA